MNDETDELKTTKIVIVVTPSFARKLDLYLQARKANDPTPGKKHTVSVWVQQLILRATRNFEGIELPESLTARRLPAQNIERKLP